MAPDVFKCTTLANLLQFLFLLFIFILLFYFNMVHRTSFVNKDEVMYEAGCRFAVEDSEIIIFLFPEVDEYYPQKYHFFLVQDLSLFTLVSFAFLNLFCSENDCGLCLSLCQIALVDSTTYQPLLGYTMSKSDFLIQVNIYRSSFSLQTNIDPLYLSLWLDFSKSVNIDRFYLNLWINVSFLYFPPVRIIQRWHVIGLQLLTWVPFYNSC